MAILIDQKPLYKTLPVGQDIVFSVSDSTIVANNFNVKFEAEVYVSNSNATLNTLTNRYLFYATSIREFCKS